MANQILINIHIKLMLSLRKVEYIGRTISPSALQGGKCDRNYGGLQSRRD